MLVTIIHYIYLYQKLLLLVMLLQDYFNCRVPNVTFYMPDNGTGTVKAENNPDPDRNNLQKI